MSGKIAIALQADSNFLPGIKRLRESILEHNEKPDNVDFVLISNDIEDLRGFHINKFDESKYKGIDFTKTKSTQNVKRFQKTFYKFEAFSLEGYDRVVFIDSDILCTGDISRLFANDINDYDICAVADTVGAPRMYKNGYYKINSGMLVINKPLLSESVTNELISFAQSGKSWDGGDQGTLIEYLRATKRSVCYLPIIFNTLKRVYVKNKQLWRKIHKNIRLLHFVGKKKPWNGGERGYEGIEDLWRKK